MTPHDYHEPTLDVGLVDGCPRCEEHAADPLAALDPAHLNDLWRQMLAVEYGPDDIDYRSAAEAKACRIMRSHAVFMRRTGHTAADVDAVVFS